VGEFPVRRLSARVDRRAVEKNGRHLQSTDGQHGAGRNRRDLKLRAEHGAHFAGASRDQVERLVHGEPFGTGFGYQEHHLGPGQMPADE
jgi:hypothetical protein